MRRRLYLSFFVDCRWGSGPTAMGLGPLEMHCEVPAFEVFADRQPVEWGLTEVIEHSLVSQDEPDPVVIGYVITASPWIGVFVVLLSDPRSRFPRRVSQVICWSFLLVASAQMPRQHLGGS